MRLLTDMFAPRFSYTRLGYGNDFSKRDWSTFETSQIRAGTAKALTANNGNQYWGEYVALPMWNPGVVRGSVGTVTSSIPNDLFTGCVDDLIIKSMDIRNEANASYKTLGMATNQTTMDVAKEAYTNNITPARLKNLYGNNFIYEGGFQEHTFTNVNNSNCIIEIWECIPREYMPAMTNGGSAGATALVANTIGRQLLLSYKQNLPNLNSFRPVFEGTGATNNNSSTDNLHDPAVRINSESIHVHTKFMVKQPVRKNLAPGDKFIFRMSMDGFELDNTAFTNIETYGASTLPAGNQNVQELPYFIPKFTKVMCVRIVGTTAWTGNAALEASRAAFVAAKAAGTRYNETYLDGNVGIGIGEVKVIHECKEHHSCRMLPEQFDHQTFVDDARDRNRDTDFTINPDTNREQNIDLGRSDLSLL